MRRCARVATGNPGDKYTPCTSDSEERTATQVAGQPRGTIQPDFSDWRDECKGGEPTPFWLSLVAMATHTS